MATIPDKYLDLLGTKKAFANIATVMKDGSPQVTPVWFDYTGGKIRVNTARGRVKSRTLKPGARVALAIMDPDNAYRFVQVRGRVTKRKTAPTRISIRSQRNTSARTSTRFTHRATCA
jgi:PPOX class probable F420-dependent enzyme